MSQVASIPRGLLRDNPIACQSASASSKLREIFRPIRKQTKNRRCSPTKSAADQIWNAFWSGGISNPLEVIEQITYLLFIKRLDELQTLEELKATRLKKPIERRLFPEGQDDHPRSPKTIRRLPLEALSKFSTRRHVQRGRRACVSVPSNIRRR